MKRLPTDVDDWYVGALTWIRVQPWAPYLDVWQFGRLDGDRVVDATATLVRERSGAWAWKIKVTGEFGRASSRELGARAVRLRLGTKT